MSLIHLSLLIQQKKIKCIWLTYLLTSHKLLPLPWVKKSMPSKILSGFLYACVYPFKPNKCRNEDFYLSQVG